MKKVIIACLIVLLIGGCLTLGGVASGGLVYGSYSNGALYPVSDALDSARIVLQNLHRWRFLEDDAFVSATDWAHSKDFRDNDAPIAATTQYADRLDDSVVTRLSFHLQGGSYRIEQGEGFSVTCAAMPRRNRIQDGTWTLTFGDDRDDWDETILITLPLENTAYDYAFLSLHDGACILTPTLTAAECNLTLVDGQLSAGTLITEDGDFSATDSALSATLAHPAAQYRIHGTARDGNIRIDGTGIAGDAAGISRTTLGDESQPFVLDLTAEDGVIDLFTES